MSDVQVDKPARNVAIIGSRKYPHPDAIRDYVNALPDDTVVISGGAEGVDSIAAVTARARRPPLAVIEYLPNWSKYGRGAGFVRNHDIVKAADRVVAFWDLRSPGTAHSIGLCKYYRKSLEVIP